MADSVSEFAHLTGIDIVRVGNGWIVTFGQGGDAGRHATVSLGNMFVAQSPAELAGIIGIWAGAQAPSHAKPKPSIKKMPPRSVDSNETTVSDPNESIPIDIEMNDPRIVWNDEDSINVTATQTAIGDLTWEPPASWGVEAQ